MKVYNKIERNTIIHINIYKNIHTTINNKKKKLKAQGQIHLIIFSKYYFLKQFIFYFFFFLFTGNINKLYILLIYFNVFLQFIINSHFILNLEISLNNEQKILYDNKNKINSLVDLFNYFYNLIKYYNVKQHYNQLYNIKYLNFLITNICMCLYKYNLLTVIDPTTLKWFSVGIWTFITSIFVRKKFNEYKYKYNFTFNTKYKYKQSIIHDFGIFWKVYYKYGGYYQRYIYIKKFYLSNNMLNKRKIACYDFALSKFVIKLNNYYDLLLKDSDFNKISEINQEDYVYSLFNMFLKKKLDTPFLNDNISFTFFFKHNITKKQLNDLSYLISFEYLYKKKKKSSISDLNEIELWENYKNFYKWTIKSNYEKNITDIFNVESNDPFITPARIYKKYKNAIDFESIFNDVSSFDIVHLSNCILQAFTLIKETEIMLAINPDLKNDNLNNFNDLQKAFKNEDLDFFDYNIIKNDLNLCMWLNSRALKDPSFISFLNNLKHLTSNATINTLNIDLFENTYLNETDILTLFLKENFFYLDYFTLVINSQQYSLCYLLFLFKILKAKENYEIYYNKYCDEKINLYNNVIYDYHKHVFTKLNYLKHSFNGFVKYKINNIFVNINNFDNINFIKKLKQKKLYNIYMVNYKNNIKINYNDYNEFLYYFNKYKSISNFEKKELNTSDLITFDDFFYNNININDLQKSINEKKVIVENLMIYYVYENNQLLNNLDLGFYLFNIKGFEQYEQDVILFYEFKEHKLLNFIMDDFNILEKIDFQKNYSILYFHYLLKIFKNFKQYNFNIVLEHLVFDDDFIYPHYDNSMNEKRIDFLSHLNSFLKIFKIILRVKHTHIANFVNYLILHYGKFIEYNDSFNYQLLYDTLILKKTNKDDLYNMETKLDHIMQVWKHILQKIEEIRDTYVEFINMLKLEKLTEFFDFPMFSNVKSFLLLKEAYYICLEELIVEERAFDHAYNISMCLFRVFDKHNEFFKRDVLFKNGIMTRLTFLNIEDWNFILELEKKNPLIIMELYNSKQIITRSELLHNNISFIKIVNELSNIHEKENAYNTLEDEWNIFLDEMSKRDLIIYDLTLDHVVNLRNLITSYNNTWYNEVEIDTAIAAFFDQNLLQYDSVTRNFKKQQVEPLQDKVTETIESEYEDIEVYKPKEKNIKSINNKFNLYFKENIIYIKDDVFNDAFDSLPIADFIISPVDAINEFVKADKIFINYLEEKINILPYSNFKNYLLKLFTIIKNEFNDYTYLKQLKNFELSLNFLFDLINFNDNMNNLNFISVYTINNKIINNHFNYFNNKFIDLNHINLLLKSIDIKEKERSWSKSLSRTFNNRFLVLYYDAPDYLLSIFDNLNKVECLIKSEFFNDGLTQPFLYLPNLNKCINKFNYNHNVIYNIYNANFIHTFDSLFNALNVHILKVNYMLNQLNIFKQLIIDVYFNYCDVYKNNLNILKDLYFFIYKNKQDKQVNFKYLALMNLLLYVKDPIYLYHILVSDLKLYIKNILTILNIIQKPEFNNDTYKNFLDLLMYKNTDLIVNWTSPQLYQGLVFNNYKSVIEIGQEHLEQINVNYFFNNATIVQLNTAISNLDQYNGYFNLDTFNLDHLKLNYNSNEFNNEFNFINMFNINKLLDNFNFLFTINNIKGYRFYSLNEFILYNEFDNFKSFDVCNTHHMFLTHMLEQRFRYSFYFNKDNLNNVKKNDLIIKDYESLIDSQKEIKNIKRKSAPTRLKNKIKKKKFIKILVKTEYTAEDLKHGYEEEEDSNEGLNDEYGTDIHYKYDKLEVTDSDESEVSEKEQISIIKTNNVVNNIIEIKNQVAGNLHKDFIQWASDLEFNKAYINCKTSFNTALFNLAHPLWDEYRSYFSDEVMFLNYVKRLNKDEKTELFNIYWDLAIQEVLKKREEDRNKKVESYWFSFLSHAKEQTERMEQLRCNEMLDIFCTNLEKNEKWKKQWHNEMFFLDMHRDKLGKESNRRALQYWEDAYLREPDLKGRGILEKNIFVQEIPQLELWDKTNWWKRW